MPRGGKRKGAGRKRGVPEQRTLDKLMAREALRAMVTAHLKPLVQRQIAHAMGIGHVYTRDKAGKFTRIESQAKIDELLTTGTEGDTYWLMSKDPSVQAFTDLLNRALDKPAEQKQQVEVSGDADLIEALMRGRTRAANR